MKQLFVVTLFVMGLAAAAVAQMPLSTPAATVAPVKAPVTDAFVVGYVQAVAGWSQVANTACQQLEPVKAYQQVLANANKEIEAHVPGYAMDWISGKLVAKAPAK